MKKLLIALLFLVVFAGCQRQRAPKDMFYIQKVVNGYGDTAYSVMQKSSNMYDPFGEDWCPWWSETYPKKRQADSCLAAYVAEENNRRMSVYHSVGN